MRNAPHQDRHYSIVGSPRAPWARRGPRAWLVDEGRVRACSQISGLGRGRGAFETGRGTLRRSRWCPAS